jgi:hypothetical protein
MAKKRKTIPSGNSPGSLTLPYGSTPWHFTHNGVAGNGFNGAIKHMWGPTRGIIMPGKGYVTHA